MPLYLGANLELVKLKWGMKNTQFAEAIGVPVTQVTRYEKNENAPRVPALVKLVELTGISFYDFCTREIERSEIPDQPLEELSMKTKLLTNKACEKKIKELNEKLITLLEENRDLRIENDGLKNR